MQRNGYKTVGGQESTKARVGRSRTGLSTIRTLIIKTSSKILRTGTEAEFLPFVESLVGQWPLYSRLLQDKGWDLLKASIYQFKIKAHIFVFIEINAKELEN